MTEPVRQERGDINVRATLATGAGILAMVTAAAIVAGLAMRGSEDSRRRAEQTAPPPEQPFETHRADKQARLASTGWVDRTRGIAHIPIEQAMALLVEE